MSEKVVRVWSIGPDGTEMYAAHSEEEMKNYYIELIGRQQAEEDIAEHFEELSQSELDVEMDWCDEEGKTIRTTYRQQAEEALLPAQIATGYN